MSSADLMAVLLAEHLRYAFGAPDNPNNDHLIFSKGHASPLLYAMYRAAGAITDAEMLTFRKRGSRMEGHPTPRLPWVDVATGSLGQGLPIAVGVALAGRALDRLPYRVWVLCGDSEMAEGSMWEALEAAAHHGLSNLTAIVDVNRLGQTGETMHGWDLDAYANRARVAGWAAIEINGHDVDEIDAAYRQAMSTTDRPTLIVAHTEKGHGVASVANQNGFHGKPLADPDAAIAELGGVRNLLVAVHPPAADAPPHRFAVHPDSPRPAYPVGSSEATRRAYGDALTALGSRRGDVVALDGEVSNSTYSELFRSAHPDRYFEMYIAEQQLVATAVGLQVRGWRPFASTFAAFLSRAADFVRMAAISRASIGLVGSHAGVSIGEDGPSQMALEDIALFRAIHGSTVLYPSDANQTVDLVERMADRDGVVFLRTTREKTPVIYPPGDAFPIGGSRVVRSSPNDRVTVVAAGITLHHALAAADRLAELGIGCRVVDAYSIKPLDVAAIQAAAGIGPLVTVEDHFPQGGLADAVREAVADRVRPPRIRSLAVSALPGSATPAEQLADAGIDADAITAAVTALLAETD
jgi:transketolase